MIDFDFRTIYYAVQAARILLTMLIALLRQLSQKPPEPVMKLTWFIRFCVEEKDHRVIRSIEFGFERKF